MLERVKELILALIVLGVFYAFVVLVFSVGGPH
jgi:hypothetical protein